MTNLAEISVEDFVAEHTITDKEKIRIAKSIPKHVPESFYNRPLVPVGIAKFKGDSLPKNWSANEHFTIGEYYPIYDGENCEFPISQVTGEGMKMTPKAWSVKYF